MIQGAPLRGTRVADDQRITRRLSPAEVTASARRYAVSVQDGSVELLSCRMGTRMSLPMALAASCNPVRRICTNAIEVQSQIQTHVTPSSIFLEIQIQYSTGCKNGCNADSQDCSQRRGVWQNFSPEGWVEPL